MFKNKTIHGFTFLLVGVFLWGCAPDKAKEGNAWDSTDKIYSSASITSSKASIGASGDIVIVWQEQETQVRNDTVKDAAHTFAGTAAAIDTHANLHAHKLLYSRTTVNARSYDSSLARWRDTVSLKTGYWEKIKSGTQNIGETEITYEENINNIFIGDLATAVNNNGDAVVAWVQLGESDVAGDASAAHNLFVYHFNAANNTWSAASIVTGELVVQNALDVSLNDSNIAHLVWLGRDKQTLKVNAYQNIFDGSDWSSTVMLSDGQSSVKDITLVSRNQSSGVAVWSQLDKVNVSGLDVCDQTGFNSTPLNLVGNWFNATGWNATPAIISDRTGDVKDFSLASNGAGSVWVSWAQTSNANYVCGENLSASQYTVTDVSTIKVSQLTNDIDADLSSGVWTAAENIQTDIASTTVDESLLDSAQPSTAIDTDGNVVVAWVEVLDAETAPTNRKDSIIRANTYSDANGSWLTESFIVSDTARFLAIQPFEKTIPNNHVAPKVVATAASRFTISWQYWSVSAAASGYQLFSVDYDVNTNTSSALKTISESVSPVVKQMDVFSVNGNVQMFWSQESDVGTNLNKSIK